MSRLAPRVYPPGGFGSHESVNDDLGHALKAQLWAAGNVSAGVALSWDLLPVVRVGSLAVPRRDVPLPVLAASLTRGIITDELT